MTSLLTWFARNPISANLLLVFLLFAGLLSIPQIRQETYPNAVFDVVTVTVPYPGASPEEVEEAICVRIEEAIHDLPGIRSLRSTAAEGAGSVWAEIAIGEDARRVLEEVKARVDAIDTFPSEADPPIVQELVDVNVLLGVAIAGDLDERGMRLLGEQVRNEIASLEEVSRPELVGIRPYEVAIEVSEAALRRHAISFDDVANAVREASLDLPGGALKTPGGEILIRTRGQARRGIEFERIQLLARPDGTRLELGDVARVVDGFAESDEFIRLDGRPAVIVRILSSEKGNVLDISRAVRDYVAQARPRMPEGVELTIWWDHSQAFGSRRDLLLRNGAQGLCLVVIVLALFLNLRIAAWVSLGIPAAFTGALIVMAAADVSLNMMSLFAFIVAAGLVVDDAIIIGENIARHQRSGADAVEAAITGAREVAVPVCVAVLTSVFFMMPALALPTFVGKIAFSMGIVSIACLLFSLVESLLILPAHLAHFRCSGGAPRSWLGRLPAEVDRRLGRFIEERYRPFLGLALRWPHLVLSIAVSVLVLSVAAVAGNWLPYTFVPPIEADSVTARLVMPEGTAPAAVQAAARSVEQAAERLRDELEEEPESRGLVIRYIMVSFGAPPDNALWGDEDEANVATIRLGLYASEARHVSSIDIGNRWLAAVEPIASAHSLEFSGSDWSPPALDISLAGADREQLRHAVADLERRLSAYAGVREVTNSEGGGKQELLLRILPEGEARGLTLAELARQVRQGFYGEEVQRVQRGRDDVRVVVRYPLSEPHSARDLESIWIRTPAGDELPFSAVAEAELQHGYGTITRRDRRSQISVTAEVEGRQVNDVVRELESRDLQEILADHPGVSYELFGVSRDEAQIGAAMLRGWLLAMLASYALMAVTLRSYLQPLVVLTAIPFGFVGAIVGHTIWGIPMSAFSAVGLVALTGVVVNDSLVLIDRANTERAAGLALRPALIQAGCTRFRAILLTSLTTFFALLPLLFEQSAQASWLKPMAVTLGFGVPFATGVTLVVVPAASVILEGASDSARRRWERLVHRSNASGRGESEEELPA